MAEETGTKGRFSIKKEIKTLPRVAYILLALFMIMAMWSMSQKSMIVDEAAHIPAGFSYIDALDFRLNPEHPPLMKELAGLFMIPLNPTFPYDTVEWEKSKYPDGIGYEWVLGDIFFFDSNKNADQLLFWARIPMVLLGVMLGFFLFIWARELLGKKAAVFALFLYAFSPNILAHTRLVQTDIGITTMIFICIFFLWRFINKQTKTNLITLGVLYGLALATKFTALYLVPLFGILTVVSMYYLHYRPNSTKPTINGFFGWLFKTKQGKKKLYHYAICWLAIFIIAIVVLILCYGVVGFPRYIQGFTEVFEHSLTGHKGFLMGEYRSTGWWYYFPVAFAIKTPIATITILLATTLLYLMCRKFRKNKLDNPLAEWFIIFPPVLFLLINMNQTINIGLRHILPIYPFMFLFSSRIINFKIADKIKKFTIGKEKKKILKKILIVLLALLCVWYVTASVNIFPDYLSYFNEFIGGPSNGHKYLIDSNIDWGQDLKALGAFVQENNIQKSELHMQYFGRERPTYRNIRAYKLPCHPVKGYIAISKSGLIGFTEEQGKCYDWLKKYEPIAQAGHSIFIYHISDEEYAEDSDARLLECIKACMGMCEDKDQEFVNAKLGINTDKCQCNCKGKPTEEMLEQIEQIRVDQEAEMAQG